MARFDPEFADEYQQIVGSAHRGDDLPVALTVRQVQKAAIIIDAGLRGHEHYAKATVTVVRFLEAAATEALNGVALDVEQSRSAAEWWAEIDELPWPLPGPPRPQEL